MAGRLAGKVAAITGGASGMGRASALCFLEEGASVVIADMNEGTAKETLDLAARAGYASSVCFVRADVSDEAQVEAIVARALEEFGGLDCIFNNAGVGGALGPVTEISVDDWDYSFAVLMRGVFLGTKHAARAMISSGSGGTIINTASVAGLSGGAGPQAYSAAKAAVINFTRATAVELAQHRIRVNAICPGGIVTPLITPAGVDEEVMKTMMDRMQPWPDHGRGEDIAMAALFLASDDSRFVTGESLTVDGGLEAAGPGVMGRAGKAAESMRAQVGVSRGNTGLESTVHMILDPEKIK